MKKAKIITTAVALLALTSCGQIDNPTLSPVENSPQTSITSQKPTIPTEPASSAQETQVCPPQSPADSEEIPTNITYTASPTTDVHTTPPISELQTAVVNTTKTTPPTAPTPQNPPDNTTHTLTSDQDLAIRTAYAAYVPSNSANYKGKDVPTDNVFGRFYFGSFNGFDIVVLNVGECYTDDMKVVRLRYTDADLSDPNLDLYPYYDIPLPSGSFDMMAYKNGTIMPIEKALELKLIDYSASESISVQMDSYYTSGYTGCIYTVK